MLPMHRQANADHGHQDEILGAKTVAERKRLLGVVATAAATAAAARAAAAARLKAAVQNAMQSGDPLTKTDLQALIDFLSAG